MKLHQLNKILFLPCFVLFLTLSGCVTYKACSEKFQWKSDTIRTVVYRDTTIQVLIRGTDTVFATAYIQDTLYFQSGTAHSIVYVRHDTINQTLWSSDTIVKVRLDSALKVITTQNKQVVTITQKAKFNQIMNRILIGLLIVLAIILVPRIFKKK